MCGMGRPGPKPYTAFAAMIVESLIKGVMLTLRFRSGR